MENNKIPEGFHKCKVCGEYTGKTKIKNLSWEGNFNKADNEKSEEYISVSCLCQGIICKACGKNRIHRPISNSYDQKTNTIGHWSYFSGMRPCSECKNKK